MYGSYNHDLVQLLVPDHTHVLTEIRQLLHGSDLRGVLRIKEDVMEAETRRGTSGGGRLHF